MEMFVMLQRHGKNKGGTFDVRKTLKVKTVNSNGECQVLLLGSWLHTQREERQRGRLRSDREILLQVTENIRRKEKWGEENRTDSRE